MKAFVQKVIEDYPRYLQEEATFERHLETRENSDMRDALTMLKTAGHCGKLVCSAGRG